MAMTKENPYEEVSGRVIGINVTNSKANEFLNNWLLDAEKKIPFLMSDEPALMYLINYSNLGYGAIPQSFFATMQLGDFSYWTKKPEIILYHDYGFLNPAIPLPNDGFFNH